MLFCLTDRTHLWRILPDCFKIWLYLLAESEIEMKHAELQITSCERHAKILSLVYVEAMLHPICKA